MNCNHCGEPMKKRVCKFFTIYTCPDSRHKQIYEWDDCFLSSKEYSLSVFNRRRKFYKDSK